MAAALVCAACAKRETPLSSAPDAPAAACAEPDCLPAFRVTTIDGKTIASDDLRGRPVLVLFWASWCEPCAQEGPSIDAVFRAYQDRGFVILGISRDEGGAAEVRAFRDHHRLAYPIALTTEAIEQAFGRPEHLPTFLLYGRDGRRKLRMTGALPAPILERELGRLL